MISLSLWVMWGSSGVECGSVEIVSGWDLMTIKRSLIASQFILCIVSNGCKPPTEDDMLIKRLHKMLDTSFGEGLGEMSEDHEGSKVLSMLDKSLDEMLVQRLSDHLG